MNEATVRVREIATLVRNIIESTGTSIWHPNGRFPSGWCDDSSRALGNLLKEQGEDGFELVIGTRGEGDNDSHVWLQRGSLIVDITADQFQDEIFCPVMVTTDHTWHARWNQTRQELEAIDHGRIEGRIYRAVEASDAWRERTSVKAK